MTEPASHPEAPTTTQAPPPPRPGDSPPAWAVIGTILAAPLFIGFVIVWVPYTLTGWQLAPPFLGWEATRWIGAVLIVLPVPVLLDFLVRFVREGHGTPVPVAPPQRLVRGGIFRFTRNPAYLAAVVILLGQALVVSSLRVLAYAGGMAVAFHLFVTLVEEPALRRSFGADYEAYCRAVPRWIPRVGAARPEPPSHSGGPPLPTA